MAEERGRFVPMIHWYRSVSEPIGLPDVVSIQRTLPTIDCKEDRPDFLQAVCFNSPN